MRMGRPERSGIMAKQGAGYTIIELLLVMAMIGVLAAIMFPVIIKARESAKISDCLSNMRQIGYGITMYVDDYNLRFPAAVPWGPPNYWSQPRNGSQKTIQELLAPYVSSSMITDSKGKYLDTGVFRCPSDTGIPTQAGINMPEGVPANQPLWKCTGSSYEYYASNQVNWSVYNPNDPDTVQVMHWTALSPEIQRGQELIRVGAPLSSIPSPSKKAMLGDIWYWHIGDRVPDGRMAYRDTLFADGHAERVRGADHLEARIVRLKPWHSYTEVSEEK